MLNNQEYNTAQFSSFLVDNSEGILLDNTNKFYQNLPFEIINVINLKDNKYNKLDLKLYHLRENPIIIQIDNIQYLYLKFGDINGLFEKEKKIPICKMGFSCSPNGIGQKIKINQIQNLNSEQPIFEEFEIGKTGIFEFQVEDVLRQTDKSNKDLMYVNVFDIQIPISYMDKNGNFSKINFVIDYAYEVKDINLNN